MNGAALVPDRNISSPNTNKMPTKGMSQYFLLCMAKEKNSLMRLLFFFWSRSLNFRSLMLCFNIGDNTVLASDWSQWTPNRTLYQGFLSF